MRRGGRFSLLLCLASALAGFAGAPTAQARCVNTTTGVEVTSMTGQPTSNQTVVCDTAAPNPTAASTVISAAAGSTNVGVTVLPGAIMASTARAIGVVNNSTVLNQGQVGTSGFNAFGITTTGNGSTLTNQGTIVTTGSRGFGLDARGSNSTLINSGTINVSGNNAAGIRTTETTASTLIVNSGTINVTGSGASPDFAAGVLFQAGAAGTFINQAGGTVSSATDSGVRGADSSITVRNAGIITAGNGIAINLGNGNDIIEVTGGQINGAIVTGTGNDQFAMSGGTVAGNVSLGDGSNTVTVTGGQINGDIMLGAGTDAVTILSGTVNGRIDQGLGQDTFIMSGGQIQTLDQGGDRDTAVISGGRIVGTFTDGDDVTMTGGQIGLVNLVAGNNIMRMSGGIVDTNVTAEQGNDMLQLSGGSIGGFVDLGNGDNSITVTSGQIGGGVTTGSGADTLTWDSGGTIAGAIGLGAGDDTATLRNLTDANLAATTSVDGGLGIDRLLFDHTSATGPERFVDWELIELTNASSLTFASTLTLGDAGTGTGVLSIDATSTVFAGNGAHAIVPFAAGQLVTVSNAGTIDLTNGPLMTTDSLTIVGNYVGAGGRLLLNTVVAGDGAPSDKLVISAGSGSGSTSILVTNAGGTGALTTSNGILLVAAVNGATTTPTAFSLARPVSAGAYDYFLFKGGVTAGSQDSWFLRSSVVAPPLTPAPSPTNPTPVPIPTPTPAPGTPPLPTAVPGAPPIPLFRPEVAVQSTVPSLARAAALFTLGTFNERQGDQLLLRGDLRAGGWARVFGQATREHFAQGARPDFDGTLAGFQAGADLLRFASANGHRDHIGFYLAQARATGSIHGSVRGFEGASAGHLGLDAFSYGGYWTHLGPSDWYIDAVLQGTDIHGSASSIRGVNTGVSGGSFAASIEGGYPIPLTPWLVFEPQAQGIWQRLSLDNTQDPISTIAFERSDVFTGRVGALLQGTFGNAGAIWHPYLKGNLWWGTNGFDVVTFATNGIPTGRNGGTALEGGGGIAGQLTRFVSLYADASYLTSVRGEPRTTLKGNIGLRVTW